jgi:hypothetical protein
MRQRILDGTFPAFQKAFLEDYRPTDEAVRLSQRGKSVKWRSTTESEEE